MGVSEGVSLTTDALDTECELPFSWGLVVTGVELRWGTAFKLSGDSRHDDWVVSRNTARSRGCPNT